MRDRLDEFGTEANVVLVMFSDPDDIDTYQHTNRLPFPILIDRDRSVYAAYGFGRGPWWRIWGTTVVRKYIQLMTAGAWRKLRAPVEDTMQLGGDIVIDAQGILRWAHWAKGPADRPSVDELIAAVDAAR